MNRRTLVLGGIAALALAGTAAIALPALASSGLAKGAKAPDFTLQAALDGKESTFSLADALKHGPVVVYFYPAAFTSGCSAEAHAFAEAMPDYRKAGATVIGVSGDDMAKLKRFSTAVCQSKFPVASDPGLKTAKQYNATIMNIYANRISFVIAQDGTIAYEYASEDPAKHVENTLAAVRALQAK
jgi:peroxiredoxin